MEVVELSDNLIKSDGNPVDIPSYDISKFKLIRILNNNTIRKSIALLGTFPNVSVDDLAIILFEKQAFTQTDVETNGSEEFHKKEDELNTRESTPSIFNNELKVETEFINNIYGSFNCIPSAGFNGVKTTVIYPATEKHIEKYSIRQRYLITETPALYENLTLPHIESSQFSLEWVFNILEHKQETERIVYEDTDNKIGFILLPDLKWDGRNLDTLYLLALTHQRGLKSLRDLTDEHLPLLRNIRTKVGTEIERKYGIPAAQLRLYIHYQPSFYHLHVHVNPIRNDAPGIWCDKSHMLDTVINNIELMSNYYQRCTLPFVVFDGDKLLEKYEENTEVRKVKK